ncbi:MAG: hypothetical protein EOO03_00550 [Chitinophagaceae bacterium]|nr:MAG: hypothetical protein EOO03_00550 [Chitinophagaceae bacterium]
MKLLLLCCLMLATSSLMAQDETTTTVPGQTSFYAELGGPGILFSANIDRRFTKSNLGFGARVGIGFITTETSTYVNGNYDYDTRSVLTLPLQLNYVFGKPNSVHTFEVGAGATITGKKIDVFGFDDDEPSSLYGTASFMYRRQPKDGGFSWRLGFTPIVTSGYVQPSAAVSVGYNF